MAHWHLSPLVRPDQQDRKFQKSLKNSEKCYIFRVSITNVFHTVIRVVIYSWQRMKGFVVFLFVFFCHLQSQIITEQGW